MKRPWLWPLVPLYAAGLAWHDSRIRRGRVQVRRLRCPVVSIGNLSAGGSGKTPLTIALARLLTARGFQVDVLSRGYGRTAGKAARVEPDGSAERYGDEPLLIARQAQFPVYVADERYDAGMLAEAEVSTDQLRVHILDDGFQHRQLARDVDILLLSGADLHDGLLPAGNLREPSKAALRANVIAIPAEDPGIDAELRAMGWHGPLWRLRRCMQIPATGRPVLAFCGIARSEQFFSGLSAAGLRLTRCIAFRDHHRYTAREVEDLLSAARTTGAKALITTEKDRVRLESLAESFPPELPVQTARLTVEIEDESAALEWLLGTLAAASVR